MHTYDTFIQTFLKQCILDYLQNDNYTYIEPLSQAFPGSSFRLLEVCKNGSIFAKTGAGEDLGTRLSFTAGRL